MANHNEIPRSFQIRLWACGQKEAKKKLDFIYKKLIEYIMEQTELSNHMVESEVTFLKSLLRETPDNIKMDPFHNKYINYVTKSDAVVFIPSQIYMIGPGIDKHDLVKYEINQRLLTEDIGPAECLMKLEDENANEMLRVLLQIKQYQEVFISTLEWKHVTLGLIDNDDDLTRKALAISKNCTSISTWDCTIGITQYEYIVQQLKDCPKLQKLDLGRCYKLDIGKAVAAAISLKDLYFYNCTILPSVGQTIAEQLQKHSRLERLHLNRTRGIPEEIGEAVAGMNSLKQLHAKACYMPKCTSRSLLNALAKCNEIEDLRLSNNTLSGCLQGLFKSSRYMSLEITVD